jgi:hypothetical protein
MADTDQDMMRDRLTDIWTEWGLRAEEASAQHAALPALRAWLEKGTNEPEIIIRAVQCLLTDPELPGARKRGCWKFATREISKHWPGLGGVERPVLSVQALLLAAWPDKAPENGHRLLGLMGGAWEVVQGRGQERIQGWRRAVQTSSEARSLQDSRIMVQKLATTTEFAGVDLNSVDASLHHLRQNTNTAWSFNGFAPHLLKILDGYRSAIESVGNALAGISSQLSAALQQQTRNLEAAISSSHKVMAAEHDFLWWGQARYSHALGKPYRRIQDPDELLCWASLDACHLAENLDIEAAASYFVETLHALGQTIDEKQPLIQWMSRLHTAFCRQPLRDTWHVTPSLDKFVHDDALGLPVTWTIKKALTREPLEDAANAIALPLENEIDRGQWASWVFREMLLDVHLNKREGA